MSEPIPQPQTHTDVEPTPRASKPKFDMRPDGLYLVPSKGGSGIKVASAFKVVAKVSDSSGGSYGLLLEWRDDQDRSQRKFIPLKSLTARGSADVHAALVDRGLDIERNHFDDVLDYLDYCRKNVSHLELATTVGWHLGKHGRAFVLPDAILGDGRSGIVYSSDSPHLLRTRGALDQWRSGVADLCRGNSRLIVGVSSGFAGPLLRDANESSGGLHFRGGSSMGKTTIGQVCGSVLGGGAKNGFCQSWHATINGLEAVAEVHNDLTLVLDELSQADPKQAANIVYMLGNNTGKIRSTRNLTAQRQVSWQLMILSTGEVGLEAHARESGVRTRGGIEVRILDIEADAGMGMGVFEDIHGYSSPAEFADTLLLNSLSYYGTPLRAFTENLSAIPPDAVRGFLQAVRDDFTRRCPSAGAAGEVDRAMKRMVVIAAAGELATSIGITGWDPGEAIEAAAKCFETWIVGRGGAAVRHDEQRAVNEALLFIERYASSRFQTIGMGQKGTPANAVPDTSEHVRDRAGFKRRNGQHWEFLFPPKIFEADVCKGFNAKTVAKALDSRGLLRRQHPSLTIKTTVPELGNTRLYCVVMKEDGNDGE